MGLIADYVESNRLRAGYGDIDPCMIVSAKHSCQYRYHNIHKAIQRYQRIANNSAEKQTARIMLEKQISDLESIRAHYILGEKAILNLLNRGVYQPQVQVSLKELISQIRDAFSSICDIIGELINELGQGYVAYPIEIDETAVKDRILEIILDNFIGYLQNNPFLESYDIKRLISDCALMIQILKEESCSQPDKYLVQRCLLQHGMLTKASYYCPNCHTGLYQEIDYCLNCNEKTVKHE